eukprot:TRINITY_DN82397_c0_g1_i1.p1 TRINITY_DN82397_c0_g1~~TRINITY_DN82397_c0_g1_i1.p1  ORF type:complete len:201 (-),score=31.89 TRINITY_DN82397_c0_g1_i1:23-580(-)
MLGASLSVSDPEGARSGPRATLMTTLMRLLAPWAAFGILIACCFHLVQRHPVPLRSDVAPRSPPLQLSLRSAAYHCLDGPMDSQLKSVIKSGEVVIFSLAGCPYCRAAEEALKAHSIEFTKVAINNYKPALTQCTGRSSAPSVWIDGAYVGGCEDGPKEWQGVLPMLASGKFQEMLKASRTCPYC